MGKTKNGITIEFLGMSSVEVTNSMYLIKFKNYQLLMDFGMYQSNNLLKDYRVNHRKIKGLDPKKLDYVMISHLNGDHCALLPFLYKNGCTAPIILPSGSYELLKIMLTDSSKIMLSDSLKLTNKYNIKANPLYTEEDIELCLDYIQEYDLNKTIELNDSIKFRLLSAGHIINSSQIYLEFKDGNLIRRVGYSGDVGSSIPKSYVEPIDKMPLVDILIGESTYANSAREHSIKDRYKDIEKLKTIIDTVCVDNKKKVLFPVFALDRLQTILTSLYEIYGDDENFTTKIIVDTPMGIKICNCYSDIVIKDKELWNKVRNWKNIVWCQEYQDSKVLQEINEPQILCASSGMCTNGRSVAWLKKILPDALNHVIFCGYSGELTLASKVKEGKKNKTILIEKESIPNRAGTTTLHSYSSHACHKELLNYYTTVEYNKLYLVHGNNADKLIFAEELQNELSKLNRTSRVICTNIDTVCNL